MTPFHFADAEPTTSHHRRIEVPLRIAGKRDLFDFLAKAFPLPTYFGHNWDALDECLLNLDWLPDRKIEIFHRDLPMPAVPVDQRLYLRILAEAAKASPRLHVIFPLADQASVEAALVN